MFDLLTDDSAGGQDGGSSSASERLRPSSSSDGSAGSLYNRSSPTNRQSPGEEKMPLQRSERPGKNKTGKKKLFDQLSPILPSIAQPRLIRASTQASLASARTSSLARSLSLDMNILR